MIRGAKLPFYIFSLVKIGFSSCKKKTLYNESRSVQKEAAPALSRKDLYFKRKLKFQSCFGSDFLLINLNLNQDLEEQIWEKHIAVALCLVVCCCYPLKLQKFIYGFGQLPKCVLTYMK